MDGEGPRLRASATGARCCADGDTTAGPAPTGDVRFGVGLRIFDQPAQVSPWDSLGIESVKLRPGDAWIAFAPAH